MITLLALLFAAANLLMLLVGLIDTSLLGIATTSIVVVKGLEGTIIVLKSGVYLLYRSCCCFCLVASLAAKICYLLRLL